MRVDLQLITVRRSTTTNVDTSPAIPGLDRLGNYRADFIISPEWPGGQLAKVSPTPINPMTKIAQNIIPATTMTLLFSNSSEPDILTEPFVDLLAAAM